MIILDTARNNMVQQNHTLSGPRPLECGSHSELWYCWKSHPREQFTALRELSAQGFKPYLPLYVVRREKDRDIIRPLFGSYGFVTFDMTARWQTIFSTRGIAHFFTKTSGQPNPVPTQIIQALQARGRPGDGVIDENYHGPAFPDIAGQNVRITSGPFADLRGLCRWSNQKRVSVLLEVMGRTVETQFQRNDVIPEK